MASIGNSFVLRNNLKRCPEEVGDNAVKCKHCGSMLDSRGEDTLDRAVTIGSGHTPLRYNTLDSAANTGGKVSINWTGDTGFGVVMEAGE